MFFKDWDRLSSNDLIGKVNFPLSKLENGKNDMWLPLPQIKGKIPEVHVILELQPCLIVKVCEGKNLPAMDIGKKQLEKKVF